MRARGSVLAALEEATQRSQPMQVGWQALIPASLWSYHPRKALQILLLEVVIEQHA